MAYQEFAKPFQHDGLAPIDELSPTKRKALIACFQGDGLLYKRSGTQTSSNADPHAETVYLVSPLLTSREARTSSAIMQ